MRAMKNIKFGTGIAFAAMIALGTLVAVMPQTAPGKALIHTVGVDNIGPQPMASPAPNNGPVTGAAPAPLPDPTPGLASPSPLTVPTPAGPMAQGAPCLPPNVIDANGNCGPAPVAVSSSSASQAPVGQAPVASAPPTVNPAANQPGQGAPCLPPGVLTGNICAVPSPSPTPGG